jgi:hypothetical protein
MRQEAGRQQDLIDIAGIAEGAMKTIEPIRPDWKWAASRGSRQLDRLLDQQLTFREKLEWLEEAETSSLRLRKSREARLQENTPETLTPEFFPQIIRRPAVARCNAPVF